MIFRLLFCHSITCCASISWWFYDWTRFESSIEWRILVPRLEVKFKRFYVTSKSVRVGWNDKFSFFSPFVCLSLIEPTLFPSFLENPFSLVIWTEFREKRIGMSFRDLRCLTESLRVLGYPQIVSLDSFREPNFKLVAGKLIKDPPTGSVIVLDLGQLVLANVFDAKQFKINHMRP